MTPVIAAESVSKWYGQTTALNGVSVELPPGVTGLLGPSGAGKSTFLKLVTGQLRPTQGTVSVLGETPWNNPALCQRFGFCPEQDAFYEEETGSGWLAGLLRLNGLSRADAESAAGRALDTMGLTDVAARRIGGYSKGMRQRLKLAQAIAHEPDLLVLDEPLSGMDPLGRRRTIRLIRDWARAGRSAVVSSHVLHEVESMTSTVVLIDRGRIIAEGDVHQIRELIDEHPHTVQVRAGDPRALARELVSEAGLKSVSVEGDLVTARTDHPDAFYARLTALAASGTCGAVQEITAPDDNLQSVFEYLVK